MNNNTLKHQKTSFKFERTDSDGTVFEWYTVIFRLDLPTVKWSIRSKTDFEIAYGDCLKKDVSHKRALDFLLANVPSLRGK